MKAIRTFVYLFVVSMLLTVPLSATPFTDGEVIIDGNSSSVFDVDVSDSTQGERLITTHGDLADDALDVKEDDDDKYPVSGIIRVSSSLRLRAWPWGPVINNYSDGTRVEVTGKNGDFYEVTVNGITGYLHENYVSIPGAPASQVDPEYPGNTRHGGFLPAPEGIETTTIAARNIASVPGQLSETSSQAMPSGELYRSSVIGSTMGDGTVEGALTWAADQMPGGQQRGMNRNNGKISRDRTAWNSWCLAFVATAYGRQNQNLRAPSAIASYRNFQRAGLINQDRNPPAGAVMFTGTTPTNPYGHIFIATGRRTPSGEPIVVTSGGSRRSGIFELTLSQMIGSRRYLGWAMPN